MRQENVLNLYRYWIRTCINQASLVLMGRVSQSKQNKGAQS